MNLETAGLCLDMAKACGVQTVVLIGGEPTLHPALFDILGYVHDRKMRAVIVSNGILLAEPNFTERLSGALGPNDVINVSVKGTSDSDYYPISMNGAKSEFESVCQCFRQLLEYRINHTISYVVDQENAPLLKSTLEMIRQMSNANVGLSLCGPCYEYGDFVGVESISSICQLADCVLEAIADSKSSRISMHVNVPLCEIKRENLNVVTSVSFGCHVLNRSGLVFDTNGDLLLCNHLLGLPIGIFNEDYRNPTEFLRFLESESYMSAWNSLTRLPYGKCAPCKNLQTCRGGCPLLFF